MYSSASFKKINHFIHKEVEYYDQLKAEDVIKISNFTKELYKEFKINFTVNDVINMRNTHVYLLSKSKGVLTLRLGTTIMNMYKNGETLIEIADKLKLPPMNVFYQIMVENGQELDKRISKKDIPKDIKQQLIEIEKRDVTKWFNSIPDNNIKQKIKELKCKYYTKHEINKLGKHPDILFIEGCTYKEITFHWIIIKPYILFDNYLILHDIQKNINNFQKFGKGLILFPNIMCSNTFLKKIPLYVQNFAFFN